VQAAAGGVGLYLVQLAKRLRIEQVIALASSEEKLRLVQSPGADVAINYALPDWTERVRAATEGRGVDVVLQMTSGEVGEQSFKLAAAGGRIVLFGATNYNDTINTDQVRQLIWQNQTLIGFAYPALPPSKTATIAPRLTNLLANGDLKIIAERRYELAEAPSAFEALASRKTIGKVVLVPELSPIAAALPCIKLKACLCWSRDLYFLTPARQFRTMVTGPGRSGVASSPGFPARGRKRHTSSCFRSTAVRTADALRLSEESAHLRTSVKAAFSTAWMVYLAA
jgi:hypothetical protein